MPDCELFGFDVVLEAQEFSRHNLHLNGVSAVMGGRLDPDALARLIVPNTLLIMDIEGGQADPLDPLAVPELSSVDILAETHGFARPGAGDLLQARFSDRPIEVIQQAGRNPIDHPELDNLDHQDRAPALDESRHGQNGWLWIPRGEAAARSWRVPPTARARSLSERIGHPRTEP